MVCVEYLLRHVRRERFQFFFLPVVWRYLAVVFVAAVIDRFYYFDYYGSLTKKRLSQIIAVFAQMIADNRRVFADDRSFLPNNLPKQNVPKQHVPQQMCLNKRA